MRSMTRTHARSAAMAALLIGAPTAFADAPPPDCQCRAPQGGMRNVGTVLCITVGTSPVMVRCEMSTNTPFWKPLGDGGGCAPA